MSSSEIANGQNGRAYRRRSRNGSHNGRSRSRSQEVSRSGSTGSRSNALIVAPNGAMPQLRPHGK